MAGRGTDIKLGPGVAKQGGLHVILTEFHEAARIDRQLIGRCGRQGDPGTIEINASLEDELITVFAAGLAAVLNRAPSDDNRLLPGTIARLTRWYAHTRAQLLHYRVRRQTLRLLG